VVTLLPPIAELEMLYATGVEEAVTGETRALELLLMLLAVVDTGVEVGA